MGDVAGADEAGETPRAAQATESASDGQQPTPATEPASDGEQEPHAPGFGERGRMRRRARFLRKARELAYRDLGGLVFDLHRFGQRNDPLVLAKLATLRQIDTEVRELEAVLDDHRPVTVLREVGIAACPRCAAIHGSDDRFCPGCGLAFDAKADRPISTAPVNQQRRPATPSPPTTAAPTTAAPTTAAPAASTAGAPATPGAGTPAAPTTAAPTTPAAAAAATPPAQPAPAPQPVRPANPAATPVRAPEPTGEDEPTQILRPPSSGR